MDVKKYCGYCGYIGGFLLTLLNKKQSRSMRNYILSALGYLLVIISMKLTPHIQGNINNVYTAQNGVETALTIIKKLRKR